MPRIQGSLGPFPIAQENLTSQTMKKGSLRRMDDPINCINIKCNIPKSASYAVGSMDIFNFGQQLNKIQCTKYSKILELDSKLQQLRNKMRN